MTQPSTSTYRRARASGRHWTSVVGYARRRRRSSRLRRTLGELRRRVDLGDAQQADGTVVELRTIGLDGQPRCALNVERQSSAARSLRRTSRCDDVSHAPGRRTRRYVRGSRTSVRRAHPTPTRSSVRRCCGARSARPSSTSLLAPGATRPVGAGDRLAREAPDPFRLCFERDLDRIKHSRPWRRLAGKCQVFIAPEDDHLRTRLTHAVEVAQVATGIARRREPVPAAGRGDRARARLRARARRPRVGGGVLAVPPGRLRPRGLRRRRHARAAQPVPRDARRRAQPLVAPSGAVHARGRGGGVGRPHRLRLPRLRGRGARRHPRARRPARRGRRRRRARAGPQQIGAFVLAVLDAIDRTGRVGMTEPAASALAAFRAFNFERIYLRPAARRQADTVDRPARAASSTTSPTRRADPVGARPAMHADARCRARRRRPRSRCAT